MNFRSRVPRASRPSTCLAEQCRRRRRRGCGATRRPSASVSERDRFSGISFPMMLLRLSALDGRVCRRRPPADYSGPWPTDTVMLPGLRRGGTQLRGEVIARHRRSYDRRHLRARYVLVEQKIGALDQAAPLADLEAFITLGGSSPYGQGRNARVRPGAPSTGDLPARGGQGAVGDARGSAQSAFAVKHLVLCRIERRPPRLNLDVYPYLPRALVDVRQVVHEPLSGLGHDTNPAAPPCPQDV